MSPSTRRRSRPETTTDAAGDFAFDAVVPGSFVVVATLDGYDVFAHSPLDVTDAELVTLYLNLQISAIAEALEIVGSVGAATPSVKEEFGTNLLSVFPLPTDRFHDVLPQLPGVVRDPRGRISFNGTRPSQSALLVNGATATDPVTGEFAVELPLKVIETVEVFTVPYSAEFGRVTGAVANVRTRAGRRSLGHRRRQHLAEPPMARRDSQGAQLGHAARPGQRSARQGPSLDLAGLHVSLHPVACLRRRARGGRRGDPGGIR